MASEAGVLMAGAVHEMLMLAEAAHCPVCAVVDPAIEGKWNGLKSYKDDAEALAATGARAVILAIDDPEVRRRVDLFYAGRAIGRRTLIGGSVHASSQLGEGSVVQTGGIVTTDCRLGRAVRVNMSAQVMHDAVVGDYTTIAPRVLILGRVRIGSGAYIGSNATILPNITIGDRARVGAGAVVTRNVGDGETVVGVPARVKSRSGGEIPV